MIKQQRIGKLQRWILTQAYESKNRSVTKYEIYRDYYHVPCHTGKGGFHVKAFFDEPQQVKAVSLSRSLSNLFKKGLILDPRRFYEICLSPSGESKARELLSCCRGVL